MVPSPQKITFAAPQGRMPTLQFCRPAELHIDATYQRDIRNGPSQKLINRLAQNWNWDLCQPLVVARRQSLTEQLYVIDGQHRLAAARLRGDIDHLPCVIVNYTSAAQEAASFVTLNQVRKPLNRLDLFKAALSSGNTEAIAIANALADAGLKVAPHTNIATWKPGMLANISGIELAWRRRGEKVTQAALEVLAKAFQGEVLNYAGTVFPGIVEAVFQLWLLPKAGWETDPAHATRLIAMLRATGQQGWRQEIAQARAADPDLNYRDAASAAVWGAYQKLDLTAEVDAVDFVPAPAPVVPAAAAPVRTLVVRRPAENMQKASSLLFNNKGYVWCSQCERRVKAAQAAVCGSQFCKAKVAA
jgi:hypothetical protein